VKGQNGVANKRVGVVVVVGNAKLKEPSAPASEGCTFNTIERPSTSVQNVINANFWWWIKRVYCMSSPTFSTQW
jgi:hypothetical protein